MSRYVIKLNPPARYSIKYAKGTGPQGPSGAGLTPAANNTLIGNASGSTATPTALAPSAVKTMLGYIDNADLLAALPTPLVIEEGRVFVVPANIQMAFHVPIRVEGVLRVDGVLYGV